MAAMRITSSTAGSWRKSSDCTASFMQELSHETKHYLVIEFPDPVLKSVEIGEQILQILSVENLAVAGHLRTAVANDVRDAIVVGGKSAERKILVLEDAF